MGFELSKIGKLYPSRNLRRSLPSEALLVYPVNLHFFCVFLRKKVNLFIKCRKTAKVVSSPLYLPKIRDETYRLIYY